MAVYVLVSASDHVASPQGRMRGFRQQSGFTEAGDHLWKDSPKSRAPDIPKGSPNPHRQKPRGDLVRINQEHNSKRFLQPLYFIPTVDIHTLLYIHTSRECCWCRGWCTGISRGAHMGIHCACWSWRHGEWVHQDQDQDYQDYTQNEYKFTLRINTSLDGIVEKKYKCSTMSILR